MRTAPSTRAEPMQTSQYGTVVTPVDVQPRILVVEDDPDLIRVFCRVVVATRSELWFDWAENVPEALAQLRNAEYSAVLADYGLDAAGSGHCLRRWCECHCPDLEFAMMSAHPRELTGTRQSELFLPKPFTPSMLESFLGALLPA